MEAQKTKSVLIFIALTGLFLYIGNMVAREPESTTTRSERSVRFLNSVAVLDNIHFDFDFINALGNTTIKTDVYIQPPSFSDTGRDNPFMRSNPSVFFGSQQGVVTDGNTFFDPNTVYEENNVIIPTEYQNPQEPSGSIPVPGQQNTLPPETFSQGQEGVQQVQLPPETFSQGQEGVQQVQLPPETFPQEQRESQPIPPEESSSATLTR